MSFTLENIKEGKKVRQNRNAIQRFQALYQNEATADVYFVFGRPNDEQKSIAKTTQETRIPAHKIILATGSQVFHQMFYGEMKEAGDVEIVDVPAYRFTVFLQYFYLEHMALTSEIVSEVMYLANKYDVSGCLTLCAEYLEQILEIDNICWSYELALLFNVTDLILFCEGKIRKDTGSVFKTEDFLNCNRGALKGILSIDCYSCNEITVFDACMNWATKACKRDNIDATTENRKKQLGDCFSLIRFPTMQMEHLSVCINNYPCLFKTDELEDIISYISTRRPLQGVTKFKQNPRQIHPIWTDENILECDRITSSESTYYLPQFDVVEFSSNERILLGEIQTQNIVNEYLPNTLLDGNITISKKCGEDLNQSENKEAEVLVSQHVDLQKFTPNRIKLRTPIIIEPNETYEIQITLKKNWNYKYLYVEKQLKDKFILDTDIEIQFKNSLNTPTDTANHGLISGLFFNRF